MQPQFVECDVLSCFDRDLVGSEQRYDRRHATELCARTDQPLPSTRYRVSRHRGDRHDSGLRCRSSVELHQTSETAL